MDTIPAAIIILAAVAGVAVIALLLSRRRNEREKIAEKWADYKSKEIAGDEKERRRAEEARKRTISILGGGVEYQRKDLVKPGLFTKLLKLAAVAAIFAGVAAASYWVLVSGPYGGAVKKYAAAAGDYSSEIGLAKSAANSMLDRIQCMLNPGGNVCYKSAPKNAESGIYISDMRSTDVRAGYQANLMFTVRNGDDAIAMAVLARTLAGNAPPIAIECDGGAARADGCFYDAIEKGGYRRVTAMFDVPCVAGGSDYRFDVAVEYNDGAKKTATLPSQTAYQTGPGRTC